MPTSTVSSLTGRSGNSQSLQPPGITKDSGDSGSFRNLDHAITSSIDSVDEAGPPSMSGLTWDKEVVERLGALKDGGDDAGPSEREVAGPQDRGEPTEEVGTRQQQWQC